MTKFERQPDDPAESQRFLDMAEELGCEPDPKTVERVLKKVIERASPPKVPD